MKKIFMVQQVATAFFANTTTPYYVTKEAAIDAAKRMAAANTKNGNAAAGYDVVVMEAVAVAKQPVPDIEITDLK